LEQGGGLPQRAMVNQVDAAANRLCEESGALDRHYVWWCNQTDSKSFVWPHLASNWLARDIFQLNPTGCTGLGFE